MNKEKNKNRINMSQKNGSISRYLDEGNPNTDKVVYDTKEKALKDEKLVQETQEAIAKENTLSIDYRNIQVTAHNGRIILHGQVNFDSEKMSIGDKAAAVAGFGNVDNQLQVVQK